MVRARERGSYLGGQDALTPRPERGSVRWARSSRLSPRTIRVVATASTRPVSLTRVGGPGENSSAGTSPARRRTASRTRGSRAARRAGSRARPASGSTPPAPAGRSPRSTCDGARPVDAPSRRNARGRGPRAPSTPRGRGPRPVDRVAMTARPGVRLGDVDVDRQLRLERLQFVPPPVRPPVQHADERPRPRGRRRLRANRVGTSRAKAFDRTRAGVTRCAAIFEDVR